MVVTNWRNMVSFATWFSGIVEHYIEEAEKKRMGQWAYLFVILATGGVD